MLNDLHILPKVRDSWTYLYVEHCKVDQDAKAIAVHDELGKTPVPCATLSVLLLGPGTSITHAAMRTLAECGCLVEWVGEEGVRYYAHGQGETRSARNLIRQARLVSRPALRLQVVRRMYAHRFTDALDPTWTLQQIRGLEGVRVRDAYARASRESGVPWRGRTFDRGNWAAADPVNRALSTANSCLYGICHSAIVAAGYAPALGFIHTGHGRAFVFDIADLYKVSVSIPTAFSIVAESEGKLETRVRHAMRDAFREERVLQRIIGDIDWVLRIDPALEQLEDEDDPDGPLAMPGGLWDPQSGVVSSGVNYGENDGESDTPGAEAAES